MKLELKWAMKLYQKWAVELADDSDDANNGHEIFPTYLGRYTITRGAAVEECLASTLAYRPQWSCFRMPLEIGIFAD